MSIEEKKNDNTEKKANFKGFIQNYLYVIIVSSIFIGVILFGSINLYLTKIAVANILPTNTDLYPFVDSTNNELKEEVINRVKVITMNPVKIRTWFGLGFWDDPVQTYSQKAYFDFKEFLNSFKDGWLVKLRNYANNPNNNLSNFTLFMSEVLNSMTANSFGIITNIFKIFNFLPEWMNMLFGTALLFLSSIFIYGYNFIVGIFYHILNLKQYFKEVSKENPNLWESDKSTSFIRIIKILLFCFIWWWVSIISIFVSPAFVTFYTIIKSLTAKYKLDKGDGDNGFLSFLKDNIVYKKSFLLTLATLGLINSTSNYLGGSYIFGLIIGIVIVAYLFGLYNPSIPSNDPTQTLGLKLKGYTKQNGGKKYDIKLT
jgi:hypothetical protein